VQRGVLEGNTGLPATVWKQMEKRREIPPNAPRRDHLEEVQARVARLGREWHEFGEAAGVSKPVRYALLRGEGSVSSLRKMEDLLSTEEAKANAAKPQERDEQLAEWMELGRELQRLDPHQFVESLDGFRDFVQSVKLRSSSIRKMFRATPDQER
jgi:hypothetical protein